MQGVAIVVGGTRRVGRWVSEALLVEGYQVHALFRSDVSAAQSFQQKMRTAKYDAHTHQIDATKAASLTDLVQAIAEGAGGINLLVNATGAANSGSLVATSAEELTALYQGNMLSVHNAVTACVPYLRKDGGRIINFLSAGVDSGKAFSQVPAYAAAKSMLHSYSRSLARELAGDHVTVNCIALGITELAPEGAPGVDAEKLPMGKAVSLEDVASAIWYLAGPGAKQLTGTVLNLSGGWGL